MSRREGRQVCCVSVRRSSSYNPPAPGDERLRGCLASTSHKRAAVEAPGGGSAPPHDAQMQGCVCFETRRWQVCENDDDADDAAVLIAASVAACRWTVLFGRRWRRHNNYPSMPPPPAPTSARSLGCAEVGSAWLPPGRRGAAQSSEQGCFADRAVTDVGDSGFCARTQAEGGEHDDETARCRC